MFMTLNRFHIKHRLSTYVLNHDVFWKALRPQLGEKWLHAKYPLCMLSYSYSGLVHHAAKYNNMHSFLVILAYKYTSSDVVSSLKSGRLELTKNWNRPEMPTSQKEPFSDQEHSARLRMTHHG